MEDKCITCKSLRTGTIEAIARKRSAKTAHELAMKEAEKENPQFTFSELYAIFFKRIYDHEYVRNHRVELERLTYRLRIDPANWDKLCDYHSEFDDDFIKRVHKKVERDYAASKWRPAKKS